MAGSFSSHITDSFLSTPQFTRGPFGQPISSPPHITSTHGPMSFAPQMHGSFNTQQSSFLDVSYMDMSEDTARRIATLQAKLNKKLGPEFISQRPGPGGGPKLTYAEGWKIINLANEVFGFNGWSSSVVSLTTDFIDQNEESKRFTVGVTAIVRITLRDGVFHEDIGYGMLENSKSKGAALDKCKKESVTDGVKRALRNFGNLLGNCLYDKSYTQEVIKIKVPPPKFDRTDLHRRPEFDETKSDVNTAVGPSVKAELPPYTNLTASTTSAPLVQTASAVPPHMRNVSGPNQAQMPPPVASSTPNVKGKEAVGSTGLQTPIHTPAGAQAGRTSAGLSHRQQPPRNPSPPQNPQPPVQKVPEPQERRVAFAPAPAAAPPPPVKTTAESGPVEEDEYDFYSEDDAFLAAVDLGEGDEGLGGPIDFDEGTGGANISVESGSSSTGRVDGVDSRVGVQQHQEPPSAPPAQQPPPQYPPPKQQARPPQPPPARASVPPQQSRTTCAPASAMQKQQAWSSSTSAASAGARAGTPAPGGFHYPQGVNHQSTRAANINVGLKRSADTMRAQSTASARRPAQGMGLSNPPPSGSVPVGGAGWPAPKREPFSALEVDEGGDVKRVRR